MEKFLVKEANSGEEGTSPLLTINCNTDGGARNNGKPNAIASIGVVIMNGEDKIEISEYLGPKIYKNGIGITVTNNIAEYIAVIRCLETLNKMELGGADPKTHRIIISVDSMLVYEQTNGRWKINDGILKLLNMETQRLKEELIKKNCCLTVKYVPREFNSEADRLVNLGFSNKNLVKFSL